ncbi:MAG: decarboxylase [Rhodopseudomonas sp.]|nr:decarboxylase [Rhodopseudomonas sp.]
MADGQNTLSGSRILAAVKASGVSFVLSVPDITTSDGLLRPLANDKELRLIRVSKEDETIGISAGLWACNTKSLILIQNTGFLDSINAIRCIGVEYRLPICMMIGLLEKESGRPPSRSDKFGVKIVEPILDVLGIDHALIDNDDDVERITPAILNAYRDSRPVALLIGRSPQP